VKGSGSELKIARRQFARWTVVLLFAFAGATIAPRSLDYVLAKSARTPLGMTVLGWPTALDVIPGMTVAEWTASEAMLGMTGTRPATASVGPLGTEAGQEENHQQHQGGPVPREILERPVTLRQGIGTVHEAVTTSSPEAQAFYDQGLAYLHAYVWIEAVRSFHQALRLDPNLAMAYMGLTDAYIGMHDVGTARAAFEAGKKLASKMSERERVWLTIRERELDYAEDELGPEKYPAYRRALNDALKANPSDPWLWIQRGLADEGSPYTHGQAGGADTLSFYKTALAYAPDNAAAHHYYAHSLENAGRGKEELAETATYARMAPAIPHAHHMHGHALLRVGRTEEAIAEFVKTKELEDEYYRTEKIPAQYDWHHGHNLTLLAMSYQSLGQMKAAEGAFREAFAIPEYTEFLEYNRKSWPEFLLSRGRAAEALEAAEEMVKSPFPMARLAGHSLAGQALLALNRVNEARDEEAQAERETDHIPRGAVAALPYPGVLLANLLLLDQRTEDGESLMKDIERNIRAMPGPDAWSAALLQLASIAQVARQMGHWELAEYTAQQMIQHAPNCASGYFALGLVLEHAGDKGKSRQEFLTAEKFWSRADRDLPELGQIRQQTSQIR
jgi:tetratricopeptide (TPR) repeat protein